MKINQLKCEYEIRKQWLKKKQLKSEYEIRKQSMKNSNENDDWNEKRNDLNEMGQLKIRIKDNIKMTLP